MTKTYEIMVKLKGRAESEEEAKEGCRLKLTSIGLSNFKIVNAKEE